MTKKFEGILLCTDFDGTLCYEGVSKKNRNAIDHFIDNGGMFTLVTGRGGDEELDDNILSIRTNVPGITMIGAQTYDFAKREVVESRYLPSGCAEVIREISDHIGEIRDIKLYFGSYDYHFSNASEEEFEKGLSQINDKVFKIVVVLGYNYTTELFSEVEEICGDRCNVCSNGTNYFEISAYGINKGTAVRMLKEKYGAKLLVCVGDSNGDIPMIKAADIGYAVENAIDDLKIAADRVTVHAKDSALAQIIEDIEKKNDK